jgi:hypothetical protein
LNASARLGLLALLCAGVSACAALAPALVVPQLVAVAGVAGMSAVSCGNDPLCDAQGSRCTDAAGKRIEVTESADLVAPADDGKVAAFAPAYWQSEFVGEGARQPVRPVESTAGTFVITDKSAMFVPPPGMDGVRIPLAGVVNVETQLSSATGAPRQMTVESCFGRLDRITFGQKQLPGRLDSAATAAAAAELKARVAALRPGSSK